jgi:hypothetical protein
LQEHYLAIDSILHLLSLRLRHIQLLHGRVDLIDGRSQIRIRCARILRLSRQIRRGQEQNHRYGSANYQTRQSQPSPRDRASLIYQAGTGSFDTSRAQNYAPNTFSPGFRTFVIAQKERRYGAGEWSLGRASPQP